MRLAFLLLLLISLWAPSRSFAQTNEEQAEKLFQEAETHYNLQEYQAALEKYKEAYRLSQFPEMLFNIAQCHKKLRHYNEALGFYKSYLRQVPDSPVRKEVEGFIVELEEIIAKEPKSQPTSTSGPATALQPTSKPVDASGASRVLPFALYGGAGLAAIGAAVVGGVALSQAREANTLKESDLAAQSDAVFQKAVRNGYLSDACLGAAVLAGGAGYLLGRRAEKAPSASLQVRGLGVSVSATF